MLTRNVHYAEEPEKVILNTCGSVSSVEFPVGVTEVTIEDPEGERTEYVADAVYSLKLATVPNLKARIEADYDAWLERAMQIEPPKPSLDDIIEALDTLTDIIVGGEL